jgi:hypothetical protein
MHIAHSLFRVISRSAAFAAFAGTATLGLQAQQAANAVSSQPISFVVPVSTTSLLAANDTPETIGYSSSAGAAETASAESYMSSSLSADPSPQPPPRRYGRRPVYADSSHNADGSNKYTFFAGAGFTLPTGGTHAYFSPSYDFQVGGGRNFNKKLAALVEFDWSNFGLQSSLTNALGGPGGIYNTLGITPVGGHAHDWSFTVGPQYTYMEHDNFGGYVIGGVGFYHKVTDFTTPAEETYFDPYYGEITIEGNETFDSYVSNAFGVNGGLGFTYKPSRFGNEKFYAEARYVYTANSARPYYDGSTGTNPTTNANYFDVFPQNSAKTTFIPITFGIRF